MATKADALCFNINGALACVPARGAAVSVSSATNPLASQFIPTLNYSGPSWVWADNFISTKVLQDVGGAGSTQTMKMSGVRFETVDAQFFVNAPAGGLSNLSINVSSAPRNAQTGETISTQTTTAAGWARLYVSSYVYVDTMSVNIGFGGNYFNSLQHYVPDQVIPLRDPYYNQQTNVLPMTVAAGKNQGFLFSVTIPTGITSGYYAFNIQLSSGASAATVTPFATIPGAIEVFDATMSATASVPIYSGFDNTAMCKQAYGNGLTGCNAYNTPICAGNDTTCQQLTQHDAAVFGLDHRLQVANFEALTIGQFQTQVGHLMTGTRSGTYINTILPGAKLQSVRESLQGTDNTVATNWMTSFLANYSTSTIMPMAYACDEPGNNWATCNTTFVALAASGIPYLVTGNYSQMKVAAATGTVNALATLVSDVPSNKANTLAWVTTSTQSWGQYNDCVQGPCSGSGGVANYPNHHIDGLAINNLMQPIIVLVDTGTFELNSDVSLCWIDNTCGARSNPNPWATGGMLYNQSAHTTTSSDGQGDETWWYPGTNATVGVSTPIFIDSLRGELHMMGEEIAEYKVLLKAAGQDGVFWQQLYTFYTNEQTMNEDMMIPAGGFSGTLLTARSNMGCTLHKQAWPGATCGW